MTRSGRKLSKRQMKPKLQPNHRTFGEDPRPQFDPSRYSTTFLLSFTLVASKRVRKQNESFRVCVCALHFAGVGMYLILLASSAIRLAGAGSLRAIWLFHFKAIGDRLLQRLMLAKVRGVEVPHSSPLVTCGGVGVDKFLDFMHVYSIDGPHHPISSVELFPLTLTVTVDSGAKSS